MDITYYEVAKIGDVTPGTQIAVRGSYKNLHPSLAFFYPLFSSDEYYFHHGVYLGECTVAHFSGENKTDAKPRSCDILEFIRGTTVDGKLYQVDYHDPDVVMPIEKTLHRAKEAIENPGCWPGYQIIENNCESFATWLKTGMKISAQATEATCNIVDLTSIAAGSSVCSCVLSYGASQLS